MTTTLVNPQNEALQARCPSAPRLKSLSGTTIGLLDINKPGGDIFLDQIEKLLTERCGVKRIIRVAKPTPARRAPAGVFDLLMKEKVEGIIEALAD